MSFTLTTGYIAWDVKEDKGQQGNHFKEIHKYIYGGWMDNENSLGVKSEERKGEKLVPRKFGHEQRQL